MPEGSSRYFAATITTGGSITGSINLGQRSWPYVWLGIPALSGSVSTSTCNVYLQGSADNVTFYQVMFPCANTATSGPLTFFIGNAVSSCVVPIPNAFPYMKIQLGNTCTGGAGPITFQVICGTD